jgi:hypothetical protein
MFDSLIRSFLPPDFDMDGFAKSLTTKAQEISETKKAVDDLALTVWSMRNQLQGLAERLGPESRPVAGWLLENGRTGEKRCYTIDPRGILSESEIEWSQIVISPLYKL